MESSSSHWLPLTEYALRSGMSISTLRRKIKSNSISFKMEEGRYLIQSDDLLETPVTTGYASTDQIPRVPAGRPTAAPAAPAPSLTATPAAEPRPVPSPVVMTLPSSAAGEVSQLREEFRRMQEDNFLRWRALEARVAGLVKKLEMYSEQMAETKMLVKIFEEKLDHRA